MNQSWNNGGHKAVEWHIQSVEIYQPRILYPAKPPFRNEGKVKILPDNQRQGECFASRHTL